MPTARRYDDPCGIARALDVIGDRWALLVVRELIFGPKRFLQLRDGLHGVSPNVLSQRLRDLEDAGIVRRDVLDPPASVAVYELTARGRALEPILLELGRWGSQEPVPTPTGSAQRAARRPQDRLRPGRRRRRPFALRVDGDWFRLTVAGDSIDIARTRTEHPRSPSRPTWRRCVPSPSGASRSPRPSGTGRLTVTGDRHAAERFTRMFPVPRGDVQPAAPGWPAGAAGW